jgi:hypothetical protein
LETSSLANNAVCRDHGSEIGVSRCRQDEDFRQDYLRRHMAFLVAGGGGRDLHVRLEVLELGSASVHEEHHTLAVVAVGLNRRAIAILNAKKTFSVLVV